MAFDDAILTSIGGKILVIVEDGSCTYWYKFFAGYTDGSNRQYQSTSFFLPSYIGTHFTNLRPLNVRLELPLAKLFIGTEGKKLITS